MTIPEQQTEDIHELLDKWAGQGNFSEGGVKGLKPTVHFINPTNTIDVSIWVGGDIQVDASDVDGTIQQVILLINGEPVGNDVEAPYIFKGLTERIQNLSHEVHFLQVIAIDNQGDANLDRVAIIGGDPPPPPPSSEEEEESKQMRIFPNPTVNKTLTIEMEETGNYIVSVFDVLGRRISHFNFIGIKFQFANQDLGEGIYMIEIREKEEVLFKGKFLFK